MVFSGFLLFSLAGLVQAQIELATEAETNSVSYISTPVEQYWGEPLGDLTDPQNIGISGRVFVVNDSCFQILNFTYGAQAPDLFFWADRSSELSSAGVRLGSFEFGEAPLGRYDNARVVVVLPDHVKTADFQSFGLWCQAFAKNFGFVTIPVVLQSPKPQFLDGVIQGERYGVGSGPVLVMDRKTLKVYGFTFKGESAPDGYFFVGKGSKPRHNRGAKVPIRGKDSQEYVNAMKENYNGKEDVILELPDGYDVFNIDYLSVYCIQYVPLTTPTNIVAISHADGTYLRFKVDFGHIRIGNLSRTIPPHVPPQNLRKTVAGKEAWPTTTLLGDSRRNFTFHLGPPGGDRGYQALASAKPNEYVWYVNGYLAPEIWIQRGVTYNFIVEGGDDMSTEEFYNPLYLSDEPFGGLSRLSPDERGQVSVFAGLENGKPIDFPDAKSGRLCLWTMSTSEDPDHHDDFAEFRKGLQLQCRPGQPGFISFTPDESTPDIIYYQSYSHYNMGWKVMVVDDMPAGLPDAADQPFSTQLWLDRNLVTSIPAQPSLYSLSPSLLPSLTLLLTFLLTLLR